METIYLFLLANPNCGWIFSAGMVWGALVFGTGAFLGVRSTFNKQR